MARNIRKNQLVKAALSGLTAMLLSAAALFTAAHHLALT